MNEITQYLLQSDLNLRVGSAIFDAWPEARARIGSEFISRLGERLLQQLPSWEVELLERPYLDQWAIFCLSKPSWRGQRAIALQFWNHVQHVRIGAFRDQSVLPGSISDPALLEALRRSHPRAKSNVQWWDAYIVATHPASDWCSPKTLWRMHSDPKFLDDVAAQLLDIATATEGRIDQLVR